MQLSLGVAILLFVYGLLRNRIGIAWKGRQKSFLLAGYPGSKFFPEIRAYFGWFRDGHKFIQSAFESDPERIWRLPTMNRNYIMLPPRFLDEIKDVPRNIMTVSQAAIDFFAGEMTTANPAMFAKTNIETIKTQYIAKITSQIPPAADELTYAFNRRFGSYEDWTAIPLQSTFVPIITQAVSRTIVGPEMCRNPEWTSSVMAWSQNVFMAAVYLKLFPPFLWPLVAICMPYYYKIHLSARRIRKLVAPAIIQRLESKKGGVSPVISEPKISLDWLVELSPPDEATIPLIAHRANGINFGASHTTALTLINCILDLAAEFNKYAPALRQEIDEVFHPEDAEITNTHLSKLWKLDSFIKESQRFHPLSILSVNRSLRQDHKLSSGDLLPKGAHISFAGTAMSLSDKYLEDAKTFDGFRFERMRRDPEKNHSGLQLNSTYEASLHFGHGRQACPGRFFGSAVAKIFLVRLLQRYDLKLAEGGSRPKNLEIMDMSVPHPACEVLFKDRVE